MTHLQPMLDVLFEDNHCLAVNKPAGLLTQGDVTGEPTLVDAARAVPQGPIHKPGNVFVGLVHRLDRPASGVVLLARTSKAAARLSEQFRDGDVEKVYWAIVEGTCPRGRGRVDRLALEGRGAERRRVVPPGTTGGRDARAGVPGPRRGGGTTLLELRPPTGRSHQLRVQLASRGCRSWATGSTGRDRR